MSSWIYVEENFPKYGEAILIVVGGVTQNITYFRDGSDNEPDWCEPCHFEHDDECKIDWDKVEFWMKVPPAPVRINK